MVCRQRIRQRESRGPGHGACLGRGGDRGLPRFRDRHQFEHGLEPDHDRLRCQRCPHRQRFDRRQSGRHADHRCQWCGGRSGDARQWRRGHRGTGLLDRLGRCDVRLACQQWHRYVGLQQRRFEAHRRHGQHELDLCWRHQRRGQTHEGRHRHAHPLRHEYLHRRHDHHRRRSRPRCQQRLARHRLRHGQRRHARPWGPYRHGRRRVGPGGWFDHRRCRDHRRDRGQCRLRCGGGGGIRPAERSVVELHQPRLHLQERIGLRFHLHPQRLAVRHPAILSKCRFLADADDLGRGGGIRFVRLPWPGSSGLRFGRRRTGDRRGDAVDVAGFRVHHRSMGRLRLSAGVSRGRNAYAAIPQHHPRRRRRHGYRRDQAEPSRPHRLQLRPARRLRLGDPRRLGRPDEDRLRHRHPHRHEHLHRRHDRLRRNPQDRREQRPSGQRRRDPEWRLARSRCIERHHRQSHRAWYGDDDDRRPHGGGPARRRPGHRQHRPIEPGDVFTLRGLARRRSVDCGRADRGRDGRPRWQQPRSDDQRPRRRGAVGDDRRQRRGRSGHRRVRRSSRRDGVSCRQRADVPDQLQRRGRQRHRPYPRPRGSHRQRHHRQYPSLRWRHDRPVEPW